MYVAKVKIINNVRWKKFGQKLQRKRRVTDLVSLPPWRQVLLHPAIPEIKDLRWLTNGKTLWMDKAFPDKTEKIKKEADDGNEDYAIGSDVENYDGDDY